VIKRTGIASPLGAHCIDAPSTAACSSNADCAIGECVANTVEPTYVALACMPQTASAAVNYSRGMPGPVAITFDAPGATTLPGNDSDGDGIPNGLDPCTSDLDERRIFGGKLKVNGVNRNTTPGDDDFVLTGGFDFPGELADVDPTATGVRVLLYSEGGDLRADIGVPAGASWSVEQPGDGPFPSAKFVFADLTGANESIRKLKVRAVGLPSRTPVFIRVVARDGKFPVSAADLPLRAAVIIGDGPGGECADMAYAEGDCAFGPLGRRVVCE